MAKVNIKFGTITPLGAALNKQDVDITPLYFFLK